jgi:hypothetical protein
MMGPGGRGGPMMGPGGRGGPMMGPGGRGAPPPGYNNYNNNSNNNNFYSQGGPPSREVRHLHNTHSDCEHRLLIASRCRLIGARHHPAQCR